MLLMAFIHIFTDGSNVRFMKAKVVSKLLEHLFCVFLFAICEQNSFPILINGELYFPHRNSRIISIGKMWTLLKPILDTNNLA